MTNSPGSVDAPRRKLCTSHSPHPTGWKGGVGASELLGDRAQRHELPGGPRRHLRAVIGHRKQDRPSLVVDVDGDEPVLASLDGFQQSLGVECVGEPDLDLGGGFLDGDDLGDPLARDEVLQ